MTKNDTLRVTISWNGNSFDTIRDALIQKIRKRPISTFFDMYDMSADIVFTISKRRAKDFFNRVHENMREIAKEHGIGVFSVSMYDFAKSR